MIKTVVLIAVCLFVSIHSSLANVQVSVDVSVNENQACGCCSDIQNITGTTRIDGNLIVNGNLTVIGTYPSLPPALSSNLITQPTIVYVGSSRRFTSLIAAYNWIVTQAVLAPLTVQFDAGTYLMSQQLIMKSMPSPQLITIKGNLTHPGSVILKCTGAGCAANGFLLLSSGTNGITLQGFTLLNGGAPNSAIALVVAYDTVIVNNVYIENFWAAISVGSHGAVGTSSLAITGCTGDCVTVSFNAFIDLNGASISGSGGSARGLVAIGGWANAEYVSFNALSVGFICYPALLAYVQTGGGTASFTSVSTPISCPTSNYD
jgi:hypothetical protein